LIVGALLAARENNLPAIGADVAVYNYLKTVADGSVKAGLSTGTLQNGGVGLAPFHDWDSKIPADLKVRIQKASDGIKDGSIKIDLPSEK
jgi:basic membrane protein A